MKKLMIPILLLLLIVVFCTWATFRVDRICGQAIRLLDQAETCCVLGDFDGAGELVFASEQCWLRHEGFLGMALRHTESDDITVQYPPLLESCSHRDRSEFNRRSLELRASLRMLSRMELPYYFNVL